MSIAIVKEENTIKNLFTFKCPFCDTEAKYIKAINKEMVTDHLIVTKDETGAIHVHGPVGNYTIMKEFIIAICRESNIEIED